MVEIEPLTQALARVRRRLRWQHACEGLTFAAAISLLMMSGGLLAERLDASWWSLAAWLAAAALAVGALVGGLWPVPPTRAAERLDRAHDLKSRMRSALDFAREEDPTPFMRATVQDAVTRAPGLSPARAAPFTRPRALPLVAPALGVLLIAAFAPLPSRHAPGSARSGVRPVVQAEVDPETLSAFRQDLHRLAEHPHAPEADVARYAELLDALERGTLTRQQALEALAALQKRAAQAGGVYTQVVREGLARMASGLGDGRVTEDLMRALEGGDAQAAAEALEELARRLGQGKLSPRERQALERALDRAAQSQRGDEMAEPELLKRQRPEASDPEPSLLNDPEERRRELEELQREREARERAERQLEELRRELNDAGSQGGGGGGSESLERAAQGLRDMARDGMTAEQQRDLAKQIEQLRQQLQRQPGGQPGGQSPEPQASGGESQQQRLERFRLSAGGGGQGQQGTAIVGPSRDEPRQDGGTSDGGAGGRDGGVDGGPDGAAPQQVLQLGGEGEPNATLEMPGLGGRPQRRQSQQSEGGGSEPPAPRLDADLTDSQVAGMAVKGPSRSQVILGAADRGFASAPYEQVYGEYRDHAESVLERDEIPPGYRFYVRRYFQLIRPRQGSQDE